MVNFIEYAYTYTTQLQYIVDRYGVRTLPELMGYLRLDRLLAADGPLLDGILAAGADLLLGNGLPPRVVQKVPRIQPTPWKTKDRLLRESQQPYNPRTLTRMSLMGRPVSARDLLTLPRTRLIAPPSWVGLGLDLT